MNIKKKPTDMCERNGKCLFFFSGFMFKNPKIMILGK